VLLAVVHVPQQFYYVGGDMTSNYMRPILSVLNGDLYRHLDRGPGFPFALGIAFLILDRSITSAYLVVQLFTVLNVLLVSLIGRRVFDRPSGLVAALLVATSGPIYRISLVHIVSSSRFSSF
jgi:4-amino-4-deoxy-L-arabinose transferase-like glycosyltransferase